MLDSSASINLAKSRVNIVDEILKWALSIGRLLVILTEIVAFSTFIYRFSLDRTLIDLHDKVKAEQAIVASLEEREEKYRNLQDRILVAKTVMSNGEKNVATLNDIVGLAPEDVTFDSLTVDGKEAKITASVNSSAALTTLVDNLKDYEGMSSVSVESIENNPSDLTLKVSILGILKGEQK